MKGRHNKAMKKIHFALCSLLLLASCGGGEAAEDGSAYIKSFAKAYDASYASGSCYFRSSGSGVQAAIGFKNLAGTYYHIKAPKESPLSFVAGAKGLKGSSSSSLKAELLLTGGTLSLDTNLSGVSSLSQFTKISPVKAKAYFDGGAVYFNASGEDRGSETNATIGLLAQTAIQNLTGDSSYRLYGGGSTLDSKNKYKGKWTLGEDAKGKIDEKMPLIEDGDSLSSVFSLSSFLEGAYADPSGKTAFSFSTKEDGTMRISFKSTDKTVLSASFSAGFATLKGTLDTTESLPSEEETKAKVDKFLSYAEPKAFSVDAYFTEAGLTQASYDVNFLLDDDKIKELYPSGMVDVSSYSEGTESSTETQYVLDGSLAFSGTVLTSFGKEDAFSLPDLSSYLEFPSISLKEEEA